MSAGVGPRRPRRRDGAAASAGLPGARALALLVRAWPADFRAEYGAELVRDYVELRRAGGAPRFWRTLVADLAHSAPRERIAAWRERRAARRAADPYPPPYRGAVLAALAVWVLYFLTLAPSIGFWDSGEYATVAHIVGIPHPPGNPLFVIVAHAWEVLLGATRLPPAVRVNLLSATASAAAHGFWFLVADRLLAPLARDRWVRRAGAACAVALSATAYSVWSQSDVNEKVYTISLLSTALLIWLALRWRDTGPAGRLEAERNGQNGRTARGGRSGSAGRSAAGAHGAGAYRTARLVLGVLVLALTATNHLMGVLAAPALIAFVALVDWRALARQRFWLGAVAAGVLGVSVQLFLPIRAAQRPIISEGDPRCRTVTGALASAFTWGHAGCPALSFTLQRKQYAKPPISVDPTTYPDAVVPRGPGLIASQLESYAQYFDWQWARGVAGKDPVFGGARPIASLLILALGLLGLAGLWRRDRSGAVLAGGLFLTLSLGLVAYLNFKYGWALERARFPNPELHEVRDRDYFFLVGFSVWGVLAGIGLARLWQEAGDAVARRMPVAAGSLLARPATARLALAPLLALALVPLPLNWRWASRAGDWTARDWAYNVLMSVEPYGVLVTNGDNDSFPLWYAQNVEGIRTDVTIVLLPYLDTAWYARQVRDLTRACPPGVDPERSPSRIVCQRPFHADRIPPALARAGLRAPAQAPKDSILPLGDAAIDRIAMGGFVTREPLVLQAGHIRGTIAAGTQILPSDTFVAVILRSSLGQRPVHFMTPSPVVARLGLGPYTVRQGLTWRLSDGPVRAAAGERIVAMPRQAEGSFGAYVDVTRTDTLADEVWLRRGRVADPRAPWVDSANASIPWNYAEALFAVAQAHAQLGESAAASTRAAQAKEWVQLVE